MEEEEEEEKKDWLVVAELAVTTALYLINQITDKVHMKYIGHL